MNKLWSLIVSLILAVPALGQAQAKYEVTNEDTSGQVLVERWAARSGKLTRWYADDYFSISAAKVAMLNSDAKLGAARSLIEAVSAFIEVANKWQVKSNETPFMACLFELGDVAVVVFKISNHGCALARQ